MLAEAPAWLARRLASRSSSLTRSDVSMIDSMWLPNPSLPAACKQVVQLPLIYT